MFDASRFDPWRRRNLNRARLMISSVDVRLSNHRDRIPCSSGVEHRDGSGQGSVSGVDGSTLEIYEVC